MVRSCVSWCRHLLYALVVLALIGCLIEIALRVYDSATGQITRRDLYDRGLVCKSWSAHHRLKPSHTYSVRHPDGEGSVRVALNSHGLRGREPAVPKPAGVFRILCLGDEVTLAQHTPEAETFCAALQQNLPERDGRRVEVLNGGVPDSCPLLSYLQLKHYWLGLQADLLIVNFEMDDIADDYRHRRLTVMSADGVPLSCAHPALALSRRGSGSNASRREEVLLLPQWCRQRLAGLWARQPLGEKSQSIEAPQSRYAWLEDEPPDWSPHIRQALAPLAQLRDLVNGFGARMVVVAGPAPWQVSAEASSGEGVREQAGVPERALYRSRRPFEILAEFCRANDIAFCDVSPAFQRADRPERLFLKNSAGLSQDGHILYAHQLAEFLDRELGGAAHPWPTSKDAPGGFSDLPQARWPAR